MSNLHNICTYIGTGQGCGCASTFSSSYCAEHYAQVYKVGSGRQRKKDTAQAKRVRLVEQLMHEAIEDLTLEGFDVHSDMNGLVNENDPARFEHALEMMD